MQTVRTYDTHKAIKKYINLGFSEKQSEGMVEESVSLLGQAQGDLATKVELKEVEVNLRAEIKEVKTEIREVKTELENQIKQVETKLENKISNLSSDIQNLRWIITNFLLPLNIGMFLAIIGGVVGLFFKLYQ